jgi:hypothetical protein
VYEFIDESLYAILSESEDPTLTQYGIFYYGEDIPKDVSKYIKILEVGDRKDDKNPETFESSNRKLEYMLIIDMDDMSYLEAQRHKRDVVKAIKKEISTNTEFDQYKYVTIGDILPAFDDKGYMREIQMNIIFGDISEDYTVDENAFDSSSVEGSFL